MKITIFSHSFSATVNVICTKS